MTAFNYPNFDPNDPPHVSEIRQPRSGLPERNFPLPRQLMCEGLHNWRRDVLTMAVVAKHGDRVLLFDGLWDLVKAEEAKLEPLGTDKADILALNRIVVETLKHCLKIMRGAK